MSSSTEHGSAPDVNLRVVFVALAYVAVLVMLPSLWTGPPFGQSYLFNLNWYECFSEQVLSGEIYPRWLAGLWGGAGASDFFFYGPLPFYVASIASILCVGCTSETAFVVGFTLMHWFSGVTFFYFARDLVPVKFALIGAIAYLLVPFHVSDSWYLRQAAGEFLAFGMLPLVVHFFRKLAVGASNAGPCLAVVVAALGFTHLPSLVTTAVFIGCCTLFVAISRLTTMRERARFVGQLGLWWGLGMGLVAFYWLPAIVLLEDVSPGHFYLDHLRWQNWLFFDGKPEPFDSMYGNQLKRYLAMSSAFVALVLWRGNHFRRRLLPWVVLPMLTTWFFITPLSWPAWAYLPVLEKIQLPYRFFYVYDLGLATSVMVLASTTASTRRWRHYAIALTLFGWLVVNFQRANRVDTTHFPADARAWLDEARASRFGPAEYLAPAGVEKGILIKKERSELSAYMAIPDVQIAPVQDVPVAIEAVSSRHYYLVIELDSEATVTVKRQHWKHWEATEINSGDAITLRPSVDYGLMQLDLPAGSHRVAFRLPWTGAELAGFGVTGVAVMGWFGLVAVGRRRPLS